jgi:two-component system, NarL family, sensor histidine kinase DesK
VVLAGFVAITVWAYWFAPWAATNPQGVRPASIGGMVAAYLSFGLLYPIIGEAGVGLFIYAAAFAGAQLNPWPGVAAVALAVAGFTGLHVVNEVPWLVVAMMSFFSLVAAVGNYQGYRETVAMLALERTQLEVATQATLAERERIARDLHDLLGHTLAVIVLKAELASKLAERQPSQALGEIREVATIARASLAEVRAAVRGYRSTGLQGELANIRLGLEAAGIRFEPLWQHLELSWANEQALAFCLREAITNVIRHSGATQCWVSLHAQQRHQQHHTTPQVLLEVWDDGGGQLDPSRGSGIMGMRQRVEALGGELSTTTSAGWSGISVCLPMNEPNEPGAA